MSSATSGDINICPCIFCTTFPTQGHKEPAGDTLHSHTLAQHRQFREPTQPTTHVFVLRRKPEYPGETLEAWGEHANSTDTGIGPPGLDVRGKRANH